MKINIPIFDRPLDLNEKTVKELGFQQAETISALEKVLVDSSDLKSTILYMITIKAVVDEFFVQIKKDFNAKQMEDILNDRTSMSFKLEIEEDDNTDNEITVDFNK